MPRITAMPRILYLLLSWAVLVARISTSPTSLSTFGSNNLDAVSLSNAPTEEPVKTEELQPKLRKDASRVKITWGPVDVPGANVQRGPSLMAMDPMGFTWNSIVEGLPKDASIIELTSRLEYEDGTKADIANGVYLHHLQLVVLNKASIPTMICSNGMPELPPSMLGGAANDDGFGIFTTPNGTFNSGYYLAADHIVVLTGEIVNYTNDTKKMYITSDVEYVPKRPADLMDVTYRVVNSGGCNSPGLPPHHAKERWNITSPPTPIGYDGYILNTRGHLHDGGSHLVVRLNGNVLCNSTATYGGGQNMTMGSDENSMHETISSMSVCYDLVKVKKTDTLSAEAYFDPVAHPVRETSHGDMADQMGLGIIFFAKPPN